MVVFATPDGDEPGIGRDVVVRPAANGAVRGIGTNVIEPPPAMVAKSDWTPMWLAYPPPTVLAIALVRIRLYCPPAIVALNASASMMFT